MNMCIILIDYLDKTVLISIPNSFGFLVVGLDGNCNLQRKVNTRDYCTLELWVLLPTNRCEDQPIGTTRFFAHNLQIGIFQRLI
jgi:hypothetical protein